MKRPLPLEKPVQAQVIDLYRKVGCIVWELSQPRATMQTEGIPDLYVQHPGVGGAWWHEAKRPKLGRVSPAQKLFAEIHAACGGEVVTGGLDAAKEHLAAIGLGRWQGSQFSMVHVHNPYRAAWDRMIAETRARRAG